MRDSCSAAQALIDVCDAHVAIMVNETEDADVRDCPTCLGTGVIIKRDGSSETCPSCGGSGVAK